MTPALAGEDLRLKPQSGNSTCELSPPYIRPYLKQVTKWSFTIPTACMKA